MPLSLEKRTQLKQKCGDILRASGVKATSKKGSELIQMFWLGAMAAADDEANAAVCIMLLSGRHEDLVT